MATRTRFSIRIAVVSPSIGQGFKKRLNLLENQTLLIQKNIVVSAWNLYDVCTLICKLKVALPPAG